MGNPPSAPHAKVEKGAILSKEEQTNLTNGVYTYKCVNEALLDPVLTPFWELLTRMSPLWLHPNTMTLVGSTSLLPGFFLSAYYAWGMVEVSPMWLCLLSVTGVFLWQTLDNMDGRQARRLGLSSPIGDFFDHGLDILSLYLLITQVSSFLRPGGSLYPILFITAQCSPFVLHYYVFWDRLWTRELYLGPISITEGQFVIMAVMVAGGVSDGPFWQTETMFFGLQRGDLVMAAAAFVFTIVSPLGIVLRVLRHPSRKVSMAAAFARTADILVVYSGCVLWALSSSSLYTNPRLFMWAVGLCGANVATSMLLCSLMHGPNRGILVSVLPWFGFCNSWIGSPIPDDHVVLAILLAALSIQLYLMCGTLHDMRSYFQNRLFHVPIEQQKKVGDIERKRQ